MAFEFPAFLKLEHQAGGSARASFLAEVDSILNDGQRKFSEFSTEAKRQVDAALSVNRNTFGSLDLNVGEMRAAATAQQARATAAREVANATRIAAQEEGDYSQQTRLAIAATESLAREEEQAARSALSHARAIEQVQTVLNRQTSGTDAVVLATRRGTEANHLMANSTRAVRAAMLQSGQQLQDVAISLYSGQQASVVFAQQLPQLAFAFTGLTDSANKTQQRIGQIATFLSGPWGLAVGLAVGVGASLIANILGIGKASEDAKTKTFDFAEGLDVMKESAQSARDAMQQLGSEISSAVQKYGDLLTAKVGIADTAVTDLEQRLTALRDFQRVTADGTFNPSKLQAGTLTVLEGLYGKNISADQVNEDIKKTTEALIAARKAQAGAQVAIEQRNVSEGLTPQTREIRTLSDAMDELTKRRKESVALDKQLERGDQRYAAAVKRRTEGYIDQAAYERQLGELQARRKVIQDALNKSTSASDGVARFKSREQAIGIAGRELGSNGFRVTENQQFGGVRAEHPGMGNAAHGLYAIDVNAGVGVNEASIPDLKKQFDEMARRYQARGYRVLWNGQVYEAGGDGPGGSIKSGSKHTDHMHIEAPGTIVGKPTQAGTEQAAEAAQRIADSVAQHQARLVEFGKDVGARIENIRQNFDDTPPLVQRINDALSVTADLGRQIDKAMAEGLDPKTAERLKSALAELEPVIRDSINKPIREIRQQAVQSASIELLSLQGLDAQAAALQRIYQLEKDGGELTAEQKASVLELAQAEEQVAKALERSREIQSAYLDATRSIRSEFEAILSGQGKLSNLKNVFRQLQGRVLTEQLFGGMFRDLDAWVKKNTGLGVATDEFTKATEAAGKAAFDLADVMNEAAGRLGGGVGSPGYAANDNGGIAGAISSGIGDFFATAAQRVAEKATGQPADADPNGDIVVTARKLSQSAIGLSPGRYFAELSRTSGSALGRALAPLLGARAGGVVGNLAGGALGGYATAGLPGAILGTLKKIEGLPKGLEEGLGKALGGAQTGSTVAGIGKALGLKMSTTGSQIGGAIGAATGIPGGDIIGSILGGIVGGLFKKAKTGKVSIGGVDGALGIASTGGNTNSFIRAATQSGDSIISSVESIAEQLGGAVNAALGSVTIGIRDGKWRVNTSGSSLKVSGGAQNFGKDGAEAAAEAAIKDLINDGVITGLRAVTANVLKSGKDLQKAIQQASDVEGVFSALKAIKDPVGAALDTLDKQFTRLRTIFDQNGASAAELADLEELYGLQRAEAIKQAMQSAFGSLKDLLSQLIIGDSGLSLRDRLANAKAAYDPLKARVQAGDTTAFDDFAKAAQDVLGISRELFGSQSGYFDLFNEIKAISQGAIDAQQLIADAATGRDSPFSASAVPSTDNAGVVAAINSQTDTLAAALAAVNDNLGTIIGMSGSSGGSAIAGWQGNSYF